MTLISVDELLSDPDLMDVFDVVRSVETVDSHGNSTVTPTTYKNQRGAVYPTGNNVLTRLADAQLGLNTITVVTKFKLFLAATGYQADQLVWRGDTYIVKEVNNWNRYGAGFVEAVATSIALTQLPQ